MGLENVEVTWLAKGGRRLEHAGDIIIEELMTGTLDCTLFTLIHLGTNNLGHDTLLDLLTKVRQQTRLIKECLPGSRIMWSDILPRLCYQSAINYNSVNRVRKRVNEYALSLMLRADGCVIAHPIYETNTEYFHDDVHLNDFGNDLFITNIRNHIQFILQSP